MRKRSGKTVAKVRRVQSQRSLETFSPATSLFLVGFMGAGKTSVGRALGRQLNWDFEDLDERIERREQRTVAEIFRDSGEAGFRRAEHSALEHVLEELRSGAVRVVALGGGAFARTDNRMLLKSAGVATVFLDASVGELWQRCSEQAGEAGTERPLLGNMDQFQELYDSRRQAYSEASWKIPTDGRRVEEIASEIVHALGLKKIEVRAQQGEVE